MNSIPQKQCACCKEKFPANNNYFSNNKQRKDGLNPYCKQCANAKSKLFREENPDKAHGYSKRWYENNKQHKLNKNKEWYDTHPEARKAKERKRYWSNPEKERARSADYKSRNPDKVRRKGKEWAKNNPEKVREQSRVRRVRKANAEGSHTIHDEKLQFQMQKGKCWWCGKKIKGQYHVDHRIPLSRGGTDWPSNIVISCPRCNESKHNKMPWEWNGRLL